MPTETEMRIILEIRDALRKIYGEDRVVNGDLRWGRVDAGSPNTYVFERPKGAKGYFDSNSVEIRPVEPHYNTKEPAAFSVAFKVDFRKHNTRYPVKNGKVALDKIIARVAEAMKKFEVFEAKEKVLRAEHKKSHDRDEAMFAEVKEYKEKFPGDKDILTGIGNFARVNEPGADGLYSGSIEFKSLTLKEISELKARIRGFEDRSTRP